MTLRTIEWLTEFRIGMFNFEGSQLRSTNFEAALIPLDAFTVPKISLLGYLFDFGTYLVHGT